jgi:hypothetical protein
MDLWGIYYSQNLPIASPKIFNKLYIFLVSWHTEATEIVG